MSIDKIELRRLAHEASENEMGWLEPEHLGKIMIDDWAAYIIRASPNTIIAILDELRARELQVDTLTEWYSNSLDQLGAVSAAIPGVLYMDPPDGGSVTLGEQVSRMAARIDDLEFQLDAYRNGSL